jgi:C4-dicarboxylate-specific signal transduction histidine kinase
VLLDARELERWKVPASRVARGAQIRFREPTVWDRYSWHILTAVAALAFQTVLIAGLLFERRHRRNAERAARENLAQIAHMNRVSAVGELTGSFAHELNTPLGAVLNNAQAARRFMGNVPSSPATGQVMECLEDIVGEVRRAGHVVQRMRSALRREDIRPTPVDVSAIVGEAVRLVEAEARDRDVALTVDVAPELPPLVGDHIHLVQVVLNLVMNAVDAVEGVPADRRRISVQAAPAHGGIEIRVSDSGPGIAVGQVEKLFEPFFTTKVGGLGLGLAISRSIVEAHGGRMTAAPLAEGGAAFRVFLPAPNEVASRG